MLCAEFKFIVFVLTFIVVVFLTPVRFIMAELLQTEQSYVKDLEICVKYYLNALRNQSNEFKAQPGLLGREDVIFSNMEEILEFHQGIFLKELQKYEVMPEDVGHCFVTWVRKNSWHLLGCLDCLPHK